MRYDITSVETLDQLELPTPILVRVGDFEIQGILTSVNATSIGVAMFGNQSIQTAILRSEITGLKRGVKELTDSVRAVPFGTWFTIKSRSRGNHSPRLRLDGNKYLLRDSYGAWKICTVEQLRDEDHEILLIKPPTAFPDGRAVEVLPAP